MVASSSLARYSSRSHSNSTEAKNQSYDQIPGVYVPLPTQERGACSITDKYCSYNGTQRNPDGLSDQCLLWDNTCSGNQTLAIDRFFSQTQEFLYENICFTGDGDSAVESNCTQENTAARYSEFARIKSWMRSPQCIASQSVYQEAHPAPDTEGMQGEKRAYVKRDDSTQGHKYGGGTCCGTCNIAAGNVDVYYWPVSNANQSCLSMVGNSVNPPDYGATTDSLGLQYWGCTKPLTGIIDESITTVTTASVMITGSMSWKAYLENPWDSPLCPTTSSVSPGSDASIKARALDGQIYARGHSLVVPASVTGVDGLPVTTVVSESFTFTSPSVYAGFTNVGAYDSCGAEVISTTMLSFAPGELSTVVGPRYFGNIAATTLPFNFADLPCPPYSVASENYYKPEPGEPYRPLIAIPSQVRDMVPWFQYCTDLWFTGFDPPRSLIPAAALAPDVITSDPVAPTIAPQPSATQDPGAKKTAAVWNPTPPPRPLQHAPLPKQTNIIPVFKPQMPKETNQVPIVKPQVPQPQPTGGDPGAKHQDSLQQENGSTDPSGQLSVQSGNGDSKVPGESNQGASKDSSSPAQYQGTSPAQDPTNLASQQSAHSEVPDPGDSTPPHDATLAETTLSLAGHAVVAGPSGVYVDGIEVNPNQAPASISGMAALNQGNSIVVASQIFHLPGPTEQATATIEGQAVVPVANGVSIQGTSVTGTRPVIISGTIVSVDKANIYFGSNSYALPTANPALATTLANGAVALPLSNAVSIYGITLTTGAPAATFSNTAISLDASRNLIFDGTGQALPYFPQTTSESGKVTTVNSVAVELLPNGISVAGTTLTPGGPAAQASGTPISLGSTILVVGMSSVPLSFVNPPSLITTIGDQAITAARTAVEIGTTTLTPGAQGATLGGTLVSLGSGGNLVLGSKTVVLGSPSGSLGGLIMGGFGPGGPSINSSSPVGSAPTSNRNSTSSSVHTFEGKAGYLRRAIPEGLAGLAIAIHLGLYIHVYQ